MSAAIDPHDGFGISARQWRRRVFAATWLSYAGYYFCRKPFFIAKPALSEELGWDPVMLGYIGTAYLIAYTLGQFVSGLALANGTDVLLSYGVNDCEARLAALPLERVWGLLRPLAPDAPAICER